MASRAGVQFGGLAQEPAHLGATESGAPERRPRLPHGAPSQALGSEYTAYTQFCGAPQHDLYHVGQIVILKKALAVSRGTA